MPPKKTQAIVLKRREIGEFDRLVTFYSKELGKIIGKVTGARRIKSKLTPHLEPFFNIDIMVAPGRTFYRVASARIINSFAKIREDGNLIAAASYLVKLVDELVKEEQRDIYIFNLLKKSLDYLDQRKMNPALLIDVFAWKLVAHLGYRPELDHCLVCKEVIDRKPAYFSLIKGGLVCANCNLNQPQILAVTPEMLGLLQKLLESKFESLVKMKIKTTTLKRGLRIIEQFVIYQMEKKLEI